MDNRMRRFVYDILVVCKLRVAADFRTYVLSERMPRDDGPSPMRIPGAMEPTEPRSAPYHPYDATQEPPGTAPADEGSIGAAYSANLLREAYTGTY